MLQNKLADLDDKMCLMHEKPPRAERIYETVLYAADLTKAAAFYRDVIGLRLLSETELMLVFSLTESSYLLIFDASKSSLAGRLLPSHGTNGQGHVAFLAQEDELPAWRKKLAAANVEIESEVDWDEGKRGKSIYFRDPAGNSVELAPKILWSYLHQSQSSETST